MDPNRTTEPAAQPQGAPTSTGNAARILAAIDGRCECQPYIDVMTLKRWNGQGRKVQKGQKALARLWAGYRSSGTDEDGNETGRRSGGAAFVFCRCQTEVLPESWNNSRTAAE